MAVNNEVLYVSDGQGRPTGVLVPIELWREIASERETAYLCKSEPMKSRLVKAKKSTDSMSLKEVRARLGI